MVCRRYESIKCRREAEIKAQEEEERLVDLLKASDLEEASQAEAQRRKQHSENLTRQMVEANRLQIEIKVGLLYFHQSFVRRSNVHVTRIAGCAYQL